MKGVQLSHYNLIMNTIQLRNTVPLNLNSTVQEVWFTPCECTLISTPTGLGTDDSICD